MASLVDAKGKTRRTLTNIEYEVSSRTKNEIYKAVLPLVNGRRVDLVTNKRMTVQMQLWAYNHEDEIAGVAMATGHPGVVTGVKLAEAIAHGKAPARVATPDLAPPAQQPAVVVVEQPPPVAASTPDPPVDLRGK